MEITEGIGELPMRPVESSDLAATGYHPASKTMQVQFRKHANIYQYMGVEPGTYDAMLAADSIGQFFHTRIKTNHKAVRIK